MRELIHIFKDNTIEPIKELSKINIDDLIKNRTILDKLPVLNSILAAKNTIASIQEAFLLKKVGKFMLEANKTSLKKRIIFIEKYLAGKENEFAEKVIHVISRLDDLEKSTFIAKLYRALIHEMLSLEDFYRLIRAVDLAYIEDLNLLLKRNEGLKGVGPYSMSLLGLTEIELDWDIFEGEAEIEDKTFKLTPLGEMMVKFFKINIE